MFCASLQLPDWLTMLLLLLRLLQGLSAIGGFLLGFWLGLKLL